MNRHTGERLDNEIEHIKQSIADILLTPKGTRIMRRTYGSNLYKLIDRPLSAGLMLQLSSACVMALTQWEKRISVNSFKVMMNAQQAGQFTGTLEATIKKTGKKLTMTELNLTL